MKTKKGVSLIILVITIIVMLILAGVVILSLKDTNHITEANKAVLLADIKNMQLELETNLKLKKIEDRNFNITGITVKDKDVVIYIPSIKEEYVGKVWISDGELYLVRGKFTAEEVEDFKGVSIYEK